MFFCLYLWHYITFSAHKTLLWMGTFHSVLVLNAEPTILTISEPWYVTSYGSFSFHLSVHRWNTHFVLCLRIKFMHIMSCVNWCRIALIDVYVTNHRRLEKPHQPTIWPSPEPNKSSRQFGLLIDYQTRIIDSRARRKLDDDQHEEEFPVGQGHSEKAPQPYAAKLSEAEYRNSSSIHRKQNCSIVVHIHQYINYKVRRN
jgi:hypothetical protein